MRQFATVTVIGRDKTGVIARVTAFLFEQRANLEASAEPVAWRPVPYHASSLMVCKRLPCRRRARRVGPAGTATPQGNQIPLPRPDRPQRFAIVAIAEPHGCEALMVAEHRYEIKAGPAFASGKRHDLTDCPPKPNCRLSASPVTTTRPKSALCTCPKQVRLISWRPHGSRKFPRPKSRGGSKIGSSTFNRPRGRVFAARRHRNAAAGDLKYSARGSRRQPEGNSSLSSRRMHETNKTPVWCPKLFRKIIHMVEPISCRRCRT